MSFGVVNPHLTLVQERFEPHGAVRIHHRLIPVETSGGRGAGAGGSPSSSNSGHGPGSYHLQHGAPRFFLQSRRSVLESALFSGREKVSSRSCYLAFFRTSARIPAGGITDLQEWTVFMTCNDETRHARARNLVASPWLASSAVKRRRPAGKLGEKTNTSADTMNGLLRWDK